MCPSKDGVNYQQLDLETVVQAVRVVSMLARRGIGCLPQCPRRATCWGPRSGCHIDGHELVLDRMQSTAALVAQLQANVVEMKAAPASAPSMAAPALHA